MASPTEFNKRMGDLATRVARNADKTVRKAALAADQAVVMGTPVDTGRARANWIAALNSASSETREAKDRSGGFAIEQAAGTIGMYDGERDVEIHITNNLPYIQPLNDGSSVQAPAGFVRAAIRQGIAAVRGARLLDPSGS